MIEIALTFLLVLAVFYGIAQRVKRSSVEANVQDIKKRCSTLCKQRNALAREYLLHVIPAEKIKKVAKNNTGSSLTFYCGGLHGLIASDLNLKEFLIISRVDGLLDGGIRRDGDRFEIP